MQEGVMSLVSLIHQAARRMPRRGVRCTGYAEEADVLLCLVLVNGKRCRVLPFASRGNPNVRAVRYNVLQTVLCVGCWRVRSLCEAAGVCACGLGYAPMLYDAPLW